MDEQKNLVIENTEPRLVELPPIAPTVKNGKVTKAGFSSHKLLPGENNVPEEYWKTLVKNPGVKILLACKTLRNKGEGVATSILAGLDKLAPDVAQRHIGNCENVQVLNDWKRNTESVPLRRAIEERVLELVAGVDGAAPETPSGDAVEPTVDAKLTD